MKLKRLSLIMVLALGFLTLGTLFSTNSTTFLGLGQEALPTAVPAPAFPDAQKIHVGEPAELAVPGSPNHLTHPCSGFRPEPLFSGLSPLSIGTVPGMCSSGYGDIGVWRANGHDYVIQSGFAVRMFHLWNVDDPYNPAILRTQTFPAGGTASTAAAAFPQNGNNYIGVTMRGSGTGCGLFIYNVNDPANPVFNSRTQGADWCTVHEIVVSKDTNGNADYAWLSMSGESGSGDKIVVMTLPDLSQPNPILVQTGRYERPDGVSFIHDSNVVGNRAYVAHWLGGMQIFDKQTLATTIQPTPLNPIDSIRPANFMVHHVVPTTDGRFVFIEDEFLNASNAEKIKYYNIEDVANPVYVGGIIGEGEATTSQAHNMVIKNVSPGHDILFVGWYRAGTRIFDVDTSGPSIVITQRATHQVRTTAGSGFGGTWGVDYLPCTIDGNAETCVYSSDYQGMGLIVDALDYDPMLDPYAPESAITDPTNGQIITTLNYTIQGTAHDYYSGLTQVEVSTDDGSTWQPATGTTNWTYNWNIPGNGTYTLKARATDVAGNVQTLFTPITVTVAASGGTTTPTVGCAPFNAQVNIQGFAFVPQNLTVSVGSTVQWTNLDTTAHTSTSAGNWDSGSLNQNQSFSHTFNTVGTFNYICSIHPTMTGTITVIGGCTPTVVPPTNTVIPPTSTVAPPTNTVAPSNTVPPSGTTVATGTSVATSTTAPTNTSVSGTPVPTTCPLTFSDVPSTNTFYANIRCLACRGIVSGYSDGTFRPNNQVTRGQLAKMVSNSAGFSETVSGQTFEDVTPANTFYQWIERLTTRGYMTGYNCGSPGEPCTTGKPYFRPFANATRGQTSKIVSNAAGFIETPSGQTFEDVPSTHTFYEFIQRLASRGVMGGYECGRPDEPCIPPENRPYFRPNNDVTRGQSSKIVANTFFPNCDTP